MTRVKNIPYDKGEIPVDNVGKCIMCLQRKMHDGEDFRSKINFALSGENMRPILKAFTLVLSISNKL